MKPFEFKPINEEEKLLLEESNKYSDNAIKLLEEASEMDKSVLAKELPDEILCMIFVRAIETENFEINAFLKPIIEERGIVIPK